MNSGTFHTMAQQWRYFSRERSLIQTLHVGELPVFNTGQTVTITPVPPTGTGNNGFSIPKFNIPIITPYRGLDWTHVTINIPPIWNAYGANAAFDSQSGSYGVTGSFGPFDTNITNQTFEWTSTGGAFLAIGRQGACANSFDLMDTMQCKLGYSNQTQVFQTEVHEGEYFIRLGGGDWHNQFFVAESAGGFEPMDVSVIMEINPFFSIAMRNATSPTLPEAGCSFFTEGMLIMRLGPS